MTPVTSQSCHPLSLIFTITWVVNNYNIRTEPNQTHSEPNPSFFKNQTEIKKSILHIPISKSRLCTWCSVDSVYPTPLFNDACCMSDLICSQLLNLLHIVTYFCKLCCAKHPIQHAVYMSLTISAMSMVFSDRDCKIVAHSFPPLQQNILRMWSNCVDVDNLCCFIAVERSLAVNHKKTYVASIVSQSKWCMHYVDCCYAEHLLSSGSTSAYC